MFTLKNRDITIELSEFGSSVTSLTFKGVKVLTKGDTVGRYANRIKNGTFMLEGKKFELTKNEGKNHLHGGNVGFMKRKWDVDEINDSHITFSYFSPNLEEGYPGDLNVKVTFTLLNDGIDISYWAVSNMDTVLNLTNHAYFNLNGGGDIKNHTLYIDSDKVLETDSELIPTGKYIDVINTKYDFRFEKFLDENYDDNFCLVNRGYRKVARLKGLETGIYMNVYTDQVGMQVYNTNEEICLETQHYPNSPNVFEFPSTLLKAYEIFKTRTTYRFYEEE